MKKLIYATCVFTALAALSMPAFAVDGAILINQATVQSAGGFPFVIGQTGSYRLSGNLIAVSTNAINITGSNVTLDLNGFTVACVACSGKTGISSTGISVVIVNGTVDGFQGPGGTGISFQGAAAKVDHVTVNGNTTGVATTGRDLTVTDSNISDNSSVGVSGASSNLNIRNCVVSHNGQDGIDIGGGVITGSVITSNGLTGVFTRGGIIAWGGAVTVTNNMFATNSVWAIAVNGLNTVVVGFGSNTFLGNSNDVSANSGLISLHNNVGSTGVF